ncbi:HPr family phosphocarrier protein [Pelosinus sp. sgz500959]|uniref:HPr family phosphocarrier protein n=1 Tax=Pelosinus sp. sgz500959 TaxID=3242472 RepID=UPI00366C0594
MTEIEVIITNTTGLHARPAAQFVQKAASFKSKIKIAGNNKVADGKSILAVMGMGLTQNAKLIITADGEDEEECISALKELIESNFGE